MFARELRTGRLRVVWRSAKKKQEGGKGSRYRERRILRKKQPSFCKPIQLTVSPTNLSVSDSIALTTADAMAAMPTRRAHRAFAKICQKDYCSAMSTMNISLPDSLKDFIDEQVDQRGFGTSSEYIRELIRKEQERLQLRGLLLAGASSAPTKPVDGAYFDGLRKKVRAIKPGARR